MSLILNSLLVLWSLSPAHGSTDWKCHAGAVHYLLFQKEVREPARYCIQDQSNAVLSKNCFGRKCELLLAIERSSAQALHSPSKVGTPMAVACGAIGGRSRLVRLEKESLNQCFFTKDGSFADVNFVYRALQIKHPGI